MWTHKQRDLCTLQAERGDLWAQLFPRAPSFLKIAGVFCLLSYPCEHPVHLLPAAAGGAGPKGRSCTWKPEAPRAGGPAGDGRECGVVRTPISSH